ncbi:hypothetical protein DEI91_14665 [Curtobacterium sp. MCBD17_032]|nr:hypothetical protein DEI91_14665 [Curtobacterium sp. MCBD17_032]
MLLGAVSVVLALLAPQHDHVQTGFVASTIGITAIVVGCHAVRLARWGSAAVRAFGRGGAVLGGVGTALMAYAVLAVTLVPAGIALPAVSLPITGNDSWMQSSTAVVEQAAPSIEDDVAAPDAARADEAGAAQAAAPAPGALPAIASTETERDALTQSVGTLAFIMRQRYGTGPFPATLVVDTSSTASIRLVDGSVLTSIPSGAQVAYSVTPDATAWSVTVLGGEFGTTAHFDSTVGTVEVG